MTINNNFVTVPAQSKSLDTNTVTTAAGIVHRQVVSLASSDTTGTYLGFNSDSAKAYLTNTSLPLPTGASTSALQTTGNSSLSSIDSKITAVNTGAVVVSSSVLPTDASTSALQTTGNSSLSSIDGKTATLVSGRVPVDGSAVTQPISAASLPLPTGAATESTLVALSAKVVNGYSFHRSASNATTTIKSGAGVLKRVTVNTLGSALNTCTIYDNTAGSGTIIAVIDPTLARGTFEYDLVFSTGLTIVTATGSAADLTLVYQ